MVYCVVKLFLLCMMVAENLVATLPYEECLVNMTSEETTPGNVALGHIASLGNMPFTTDSVASENLPWSNVSSGQMSVLSLQYCTIGNCTIVLKNTGQLLYIIDVISDDVMMVGSNDSVPFYLMIIMIAEGEMPCKVKIQDEGSWFLFVFNCVVSCLILVFTLIILIFHVLLVDLRRRMMGKLIIINNISLVLTTLDINMMYVLRYFNTASWWLCRLLSYLSVSLTAYEVSASLLLLHVGYLTYRSFRLLPDLSSQLSKKLFYGYIAFLLVSVTPILVYMIVCDLFGVGASPMFDHDGQCRQLFSVHHSVLVMLLFQLVVHKLFQITVLFLVILYWVNMYCASENNVVNFKASRKYYLLLKAVVTIGATIGMVGYLLVASSLVSGEYSLLVIAAGSISMVLLQGVMMVYVVCSKWVWRQLVLSVFSRKQIECLFGV